MKQKVFLAVVLVASLFAFSAPAYAVAVGSTSYEMWSQPPDWPLGFDILSYTPSNDQTPGYAVADDFRTDNTRNPITDLHWWGSYQSDPGPLAAPTTSFWVGFWTDVPADPLRENMPYSYPGTLVKKYDFGNVVGNFDNVQRWTGHNGYYYSVDFTSDPLIVNPDTVYWVSILADVNPEHPDQGWGWKTAATHWNDDAISAFIAPNTPEPKFGDPLYPSVGFPVELIYPDNHPNHGQSVDMAFKVTASPEPISCFLFITGGAALAGRRFLRRKKA